MNRVDQFGEHSPPIRSSARVLWLRMLFSAMVGVCAALFSMWFMSVLIATGEQRLDQSKRVQMLDFVRVQSSETTQTKQRKPRKPEVAPPPDVPQAPASATQSALQDIAVSALPATAQTAVDASATGLNFGNQDGEYLPIVKIAAFYPLAARQRKIEGTCLVTYTVTRNGSVKKPSVVPGECSHPMFEKVSVDAALKFRYKPRVVNGTAIEVPGVYNRFVFKLQYN